jgi:threonine synthase
MGGIIAKQMGLPVKRFIIATNENDEVPNYFNKGLYKAIVPSRNCISSAMNVGHPSNLARIVAIYGGVMDEKGKITKNPNNAKLKNDLYSISISDSETKQVLMSIFDNYMVLLEPHGSVGWAGLQHFYNDHKEINSNEQLSVTLETAHPAKFPKEINEILGIDPILPPSLLNLDAKKEIMTNISSDYKDFKSYLLKNYN